MLLSKGGSISISVDLYFDLKQKNKLNFNGKFMCQNQLCKIQFAKYAQLTPICLNQSKTAIEHTGRYFKSGFRTENL